MSAIKDGKLQHVSASQIKTFQACQRKWAFDKCFGFRQPPSSATERGENLHKQMERWYLDGVTPTHPSCRLAITNPDIPQPGPDIYIEYPNSYKMDVELAGVGLKGRIDLFDTSRLSEEGTVYVYDWKTTKNFRYTKNHEQLNRDLQGLLYAFFIFNHLPSCREVVFSHVYLLAPDDVATTPADADTDPDLASSKFKGSVKIVQNDGWTKDDVERLLPEVESEVKRMALIASNTAEGLATWSDVPACFSECDAYGGCYYRAFCHQGLTLEKAKEMKDLREWVPEVDEPTQHVVTLEQLVVKRKEAMDRINPPDAPSVPPAKQYVPPIQPEQKWPAELRDLAMDGFILLVDCMPQEGATGEVQYLSNLIKERADVIANERGVQDIRQIKFGEGTTALCATFIKMPPRGVIVANTGGLSTQVIDVLAPMAKLVIRGRVG